MATSTNESKQFLRERVSEIERLYNELDFRSANPFWPTIPELTAPLPPPCQVLIFDVRDATSPFSLHFPAKIGCNTLVYPTLAHFGLEVLAAASGDNRLADRVLATADPVRAAALIPPRADAASAVDIAHNEAIVGKETYFLFLGRLLKFLQRPELRRLLQASKGKITSLGDGGEEGRRLEHLRRFFNQKSRKEIEERVEALKLTVVLHINQIEAEVAAKKAKRSHNRSRRAATRR